MPELANFAHTTTIFEEGIKWERREGYDKALNEIKEAQISDKGVTKDDFERTSESVDITDTKPQH